MKTGRIGLVLVRLTLNPPHIERYSTSGRTAVAALRRLTHPSISAV